MWWPGVKMIDIKPDGWVRILGPIYWKRESTPKSCPLASTCALGTYTHTHAHTHTQIKTTQNSNDSMKYWSLLHVCDIYIYYIYIQICLNANICSMTWSTWIPLYHPPSLLSTGWRTLKDWKLSTGQRRQSNAEEYSSCIHLESWNKDIVVALAERFKFRWQFNHREMFVPWVRCP